MRVSGRWILLVGAAAGFVVLSCGVIRLRGVSFFAIRDDLVASIRDFS